MEHWNWEGQRNKNNLMKAIKNNLMVGLLLLTSVGLAQTEGHQHTRTDSTSKVDHQNMGMQHSQEVPMGHGFSLNLPMGRNGSGTGWLPDNSPMNGYMLHSKKW